MGADHRRGRGTRRTRPDAGPRRAARLCPLRTTRFPHPRPCGVPARTTRHPDREDPAARTRRRTHPRNRRRVTAARERKKIMAKTGTRLRSQVCTTEVIIVRAADSLDDLRAGGVPMVPIDGGAAPSDGGPQEGFADGNLIGKRYVDDQGAEVLVTKAGAGTLSVGATPLTIKEAKPLPASD